MLPFFSSINYAYAALWDMTKIVLPSWDIELGGLVWEAGI